MLADEWYDIVFDPEHAACYMHAGGHFATRHPALHDKLIATMVMSHPGLKMVRVPLHVRCIELHAYTVGGGLITPGHKDNGSKFTLIVQLSESSTFEGGRFVTYHEGEAVQHELKAGDGLLINSEKMHNVSPVTRGVRYSLVIELWVAPANTLDRFS